MTKSVAIDEVLIREAQELGHHKNGKEAVIAALKEYIQRNKQMAVIELFGQIEYQADYDYQVCRKTSSFRSRM